MVDESDYFRAYARDVGLNPLVGGVNNVQDALTAAGGGLFVATAHLNAVAIGTLFSAPTQIVAAPGAGEVIGFIAANVEYVRGAAGTSHYDGSAFLYYATSGPSSGAVSTDFAMTTMNVLPNVSAFTPVAARLSGSGVIPRSVAENAPLIVGATTNPTKVGPIVTATVADGGSGYAVGDTGTIGPDSFTGDDTGTYLVTAETLGVVTAFTVTAPGIGYPTIDNPQPTAVGGTQPGVGVGLTVNVDAIGVAAADLYVTVVYQIIALH